ncbi:MAG: hypothetical protein AAGH15_14575 [Myxococcota bacterium]
MLLKRRIPRVATAALVLGACGDDAAATPSNVGTVYCQGLERCAYNEFITFYAGEEPGTGDLDRCIYVRTAYFAREAGDFEMAYGESCREAFLALADCERRFLLTECDTVMADLACADLAQTRDDACR